ncbi:MAG: M56 family metallopeptidase [Microcoleaceae cyanobacterium]
MHLFMILVALGWAMGLRLFWKTPQTLWTRRWRQALTRLTIPPLLLLTTAIAILCMGPQGEMLGHGAGWMGYGLAWGFLGWAVILNSTLSVQGWRMTQRTRQYPQVTWQGCCARLLDSPMLFCAQIGFWQPELVITQGLLQQLNSDQQRAVLVHEQAHAHYRDTFWFFWLGWCRHLTFWLPQTEFLWQELLLLREMRADQRAAQHVDRLVLAETLLLMVRHPVMLTEQDSCAAFSCPTSPNRLTERIDALLSEPISCSHNPVWVWQGLLLTLFPLIAIPFHS